MDSVEVLRCKLFVVSVLSDAPDLLPPDWLPTDLVGEYVPLIVSLMFGDFGGERYLEGEGGPWSSEGTRKMLCGVLPSE